MIKKRNYIYIYRVRSSLFDSLVSGGKPHGRNEVEIDARGVACPYNARSRRGTKHVKTVNISRDENGITPEGMEGPNKFISDVL